MLFARPASEIMSCTSSNAKASARTARRSSSPLRWLLHRIHVRRASGSLPAFQRDPENFWNPAFQSHANTAVAVACVVLVAQVPSDHAEFLAAFAAADSRRTPDGVTITTARGDIEVLTPAAFASRFGVLAPDISGGARLAALRFLVRDANLLAEVPSIAGLYAGNITVIGQQDAMGAVLVFEPSR